MQLDNSFEGVVLIEKMRNRLPTISGDLSVAGFDDIPLSSYTLPRFSGRRKKASTTQLAVSQALHRSGANTPGLLTGERNIREASH
jgi:DNA-binding LacI/PurR family transcriptional regulator